MSDEPKSADGKDQPRSAPIVSGVLIVTPCDHGPVQQMDTVSCGHCGYTSIWVAGSEKWWSKCLKCGELRCGKESCRNSECVPVEQWLENVEKGRREDFRPLLVAARM